VFFPLVPRQYCLLMVCTLRDQFGTNGTINFCSVTAQMNIEHGQTDGLTTFRKPSFSPNGNVFDSLGHLYTCEHEILAKTLTVSVRFW